MVTFARPVGADWAVTGAPEGRTRESRNAEVRTKDDALRMLILGNG